MLLSRPLPLPHVFSRFISYNVSGRRAKLRLGINPKRGGEEEEEGERIIASSFSINRILDLVDLYFSLRSFFSPSFFV